NPVELLEQLLKIRIGHVGSRPGAEGAGMNKVRWRMARAAAGWVDRRLYQHCPRTRCATGHERDRVAGECGLDYHRSHIHPRAVPLSTVRIIKKYPNRRLYDTEQSRYITLADLRTLIADGIDIEVQD